MRSTPWLHLAMLALLAAAGCDDSPTADPVDSGPATLDGLTPDPDDGVPLPDAAPDPDDGAPPPDAAPDPDDGVPPPDAAPPPADLGPAGDLAPLPTPPPTEAVTAGGFASSPVCAQCHTAAAGSAAMRDSAGRAIGPYDLWQSSMMANAARDPLWRAVMSAEAATNSNVADVVEAKCLSCHSAAGYRAAGGEVDARLLTDPGPEGQIARDGVNCTTCHQIPAEGLGTPAVYSGAWEAGPDPVAYGPHADPFANPMVNNSGFTPVPSDHMTGSALCSACHVLETPTFELQGAGEDEHAVPSGHTLLEQATFLEWRNSAFAAEDVTCQACHLPTADADGEPIRTAIARRPNGGDFPRVGARAPVGRHVMVGGNTLVPQILRDFGEQLGVLASPAAFDATLAATQASLESAAWLELGALAEVDGAVQVAATVRNRTGHKLPSGFPSRRMWLQLTAYDASGAVVFESGRANAQGQIMVGDGVADFEQVSGPVHPPQQVIERPDQVMVWAAQMCTPDGDPTWRLLRGATYCRDNRLLPRGWQADHPDGPATAPAGVEADPDFQAGEDTVVYRLPAQTARVEAALRYQPLDARFAAQLFFIDTAEVRALRYYLARVDQTPAVMARAEASR